jgi:predicted pyridoxine 5'-phosphate oxidase superfamily flavin-nucleotide-binding protein
VAAAAPIIIVPAAAQPRLAFGKNGKALADTGWPYVQYRGGPTGFLKVLDESTLAYADFRGNLQYISTGNLSQDDRVALFLMDYPNKKRLKIAARTEVFDIGDRPDLGQQSSPDTRPR